MAEVQPLHGAGQQLRKTACGPAGPPPAGLRPVRPTAGPSCPMTVLRIRHAGGAQRTRGQAEPDLAHSCCGTWCTARPRHAAAPLAVPLPVSGADTPRPATAPCNVAGQPLAVRLRQCTVAPLRTQSCSGRAEHKHMCCDTAVQQRVRTDLRADRVHLVHGHHGCAIGRASTGAAQPGSARCNSTMLSYDSILADHRLVRRGPATRCGGARHGQSWTASCLTSGCASGGCPCATSLLVAGSASAKHRGAAPGLPEDDHVVSSVHSLHVCTRCACSWQSRAVARRAAELVSCADTAWMYTSSTIHTVDVPSAGATGRASLAVRWLDSRMLSYDVHPHIMRCLAARDPRCIGRAEHLHCVCTDSLRLSRSAAAAVAAAHQWHGHLLVQDSVLGRGGAGRPRARRGSSYDGIRHHAVQPHCLRSWCAARLATGRASAGAVQRGTAMCSSTMPGRTGSASGRPPSMPRACLSPSCGALALASSQRVSATRSPRGAHQVLLLLAAGCAIGRAVGQPDAVPQGHAMLRQRAPWSANDRVAVMHHLGAGHRQSRCPTTASCCRAAQPCCGSGCTSAQTALGCPGVSCAGRASASTCASAEHHVLVHHAAAAPLAACGPPGAEWPEAILLAEAGPGQTGSVL